MIWLWARERPGRAAVTVFTVLALAGLVLVSAVIAGWPLWTGPVMIVAGIGGGIVLGQLIVNRR